MGHRGTTMTLVGVVLALGCTITPVWGSHRNFGVLNPESTAANGLKDSAASVVITTTSEQSKRLLESETHCTCTHKCEVHCATELKVCCGTRGSSCNCSALGTCPVCVPNHFDLDDLGPPTVTYDLTLGYVFPPGPEVFPVGYWTVGGTGTVYTPKFRALITRGDNYSVYNLCGRACQVCCPQSVLVPLSTLLYPRQSALSPPCPAICPLSCSLDPHCADCSSKNWVLITGL